MGVVADTALVRRGKGPRRRMGRRTCVTPSNEQTKQPVGVVREIRRPNPPENLLSRQWYILLLPQDYLLLPLGEELLLMVVEWRRGAK